ncbi:MAG TPA: hypothetical protein VEQ63_09275 [Bryobacteraceae bacterium]|nr:hypothetical protein [Bryobacteraceae bacterium]
MTWLSAIASSLLLVNAAAAAVVSGSVSLQGGKAGAGQDASGVVVWLEPVGSEPRKPDPKRAILLQKEKTFIPHVLAVPVNSSVEFPNSDPIFHNAFSNFSGQLFDLGLYPPGQSRAVKFRRPGIVRVFCNIHPHMSAVIAVLSTPYFDVTGPDGSFRMLDVPPGEYTMRIFHERSTEATLLSLQRNLRITADTAIPKVQVSEAGFIPLPHKNKYGKEYPAGAGQDRPGYSRR